MLNEQSFIKKFALDPYTAEEEREAFLNYKADKSIESNIFNHNIPLLSWLMNKYESSAKYFNLSNSDLWEVLMETLLWAIRHFDVECGCRFSTFATSCARRELSKIWKKQQSFDRLVAKSNLSLEKSILNDESIMRNLLIQLSMVFDRIAQKKFTSNKKYCFKFYMLETTQYNYKDSSKMYKEQTQLGF